MTLTNRPGNGAAGIHSEAGVTAHHESLTEMVGSWMDQAP